MGSSARHGAKSRPVSGVGEAHESGVGSCRRSAGAGVPGAELFHRARSRVGVGRAHRGRVRLRFQSVYGGTPRLWLPGRRAGSALAHVACRNPGRAAARHGAPLGYEPPGRRGCLLPPASVRARARRPEGLRAGQGARNVLHPPVGSRHPPTPASRLLARPDSPLRRSRTHDVAARAAARGVRLSLGTGGGHGGPIAPICPGGATSGVAVTITVERFTGSPANWDAFVQGADGGTHCHLWGWKSIVERVLGNECIYLAARSSDGQLVGVLPIVRVQSRLFGRYLVSMPFLNAGGPLGEERAVRQLVDRVVEVAEGQRVDLLELRSTMPRPLDLPVSHRKITVILDLPARQPRRLWDGLAAKVRNQVRRPQKEGISMRFGSDQLGPFFEVFSRHMRELGTPTQPRGLV